MRGCAPRQIHERQHRSCYAASLCIELADFLILLGHPGDAVVHLERAATLQLDAGALLAGLASLRRAIACRVAQRDYDGAAHVAARIVGLVTAAQGSRAGSAPRWP